MSELEDAATSGLHTVGARAKVLLVGLGNAGMLYDSHPRRGEPVLSHAGAFSAHVRFELVAGVDPIEERREMFAMRYAASVFSDVREAASATQPDVAVVASPTDLRVEHVRTILEVSRPAVILCEKPLAWSPGDAQIIVDLCATAHCRLLVNYQRRVEPDANAAHAIFVAQPSEFPFRGVCWYSKGALHSASHFVDLLTFWFGRPVRAAVMRPPVRYGVHDAELDFRLTFPDGDVTFLSVGTDQTPVYRLELIASSGDLRYDGASNRYRWRPAHQQGTARSTAEDVVLENSTAGAFLEVAHAVARTLDGEMTDLCDGESASQTISLLSDLMFAEGHPG